MFNRQTAAAVNQGELKKKSKLGKWNTAGNQYRDVYVCLYHRLGGTIR